ncbi:MAG TPA: PxKF domain-containing protein, partial [Pyrinomonadaceae bacterium]|nr:PxKF domain-containing protein [Pyrinomonadaceae bacterium]
SIDGNSSATTIDTSSLQSVGGSISVSDNAAAGSIDLGSLPTAGGSVNINDNTSATVIDLASLTTAGGDLFVVGNGPCTSVILGALATITGNLTVESCGTGMFTLGSVAAAGNATLNTTGYTAVNGTTANGRTTISNGTGEAAMTVNLPAFSFTTPVTYLLTHLDPASLAPEPGLDANNAPATIDPVAAYRITFGIPTLNRDATLSFDVSLAGLDADTANAMLAALANGNATLATRGDAAVSQYQAFPICSTGQQPTAGGCVLVELLDANGQPTTGTPAIVRFSNVVGHFSTWAVAIVSPQSNPTNSFNGLLSPYPATPQTTPTFKRGSVVPLKFNWINTAGVIVDSAAANPSVAVFPTSCATQTPSTTPITAEDAGNSGGLRYDSSTQTWIFNWTTRPLAAGCYSVRVTTSNAAFAAPTTNFPIALRDR